jgi:hypothetical protein
MVSSLVPIHKDLISNSDTSLSEAFIKLCQHRRWGGIIIKCVLKLYCCLICSFKYSVRLTFLIYNREVAQYNKSCDEGKKCKDNYNISLNLTDIKNLKR